MQKEPPMSGKSTTMTRENENEKIITQCKILVTV